MRRISEKRSFLVLETVKNVKKEIFTINTDIIFLLRHYDKRIHFYNDNNKSRVCKRFLKTRLVYSERIPFDINLDFYKNLEILEIKSTSFVDLGYFSNTKLKRIVLNKIDCIKMTSEIKIKELKIVNCALKLDMFMQILKIPILKSLSLTNVKIYDKLKKPELNKFYNSESSEENYRDENVTNEVINLFHEDFINNRICNLLQFTDLKKLTLIDTNIYFETIKKSGILKNINILKYLNLDCKIFFSFSFSIYSFLQTNLEEICIKDIENLKTSNIKLITQQLDFANIKRLDLINCDITNDIINILKNKFIKIEEFGFKGCNFVSVSFTKFIYAFRNKVKYLNLIDAELPMDSLFELKTKLQDCKVIFRDKKKLICKN